MKRKSKYRWLVLLVPFLLGVYGYSLIYGDNWLGAIYSSLRLYGLNTDVSEEEINLYIQIARWLAAAATTSFIMLFFHRVFIEIGLRWKLKNPDMVVIHGDGLRKETVVSAIGKHVIPMSGKTCFDAKKHVLAFDSDIAAIRYLQENEDKLLDKQDKKVYFSSYEYEPSDYAQMGLIVSNNAVNCARVYWRDHWVQDSSIQKIAIVGFGSYAQRILEQALLVNIVAWRPSIEYHVFGNDGHAYQRWHPQLENAIAVNKSDPKMDSVFFHPSIEKEGIAALETTDRIILAFDSHEENLLCLNKLLSAGICGKIHVRGNNKLLNQLQYMPEKQKQLINVDIVVFGDDADMYSREVIMHGELNSIAKQAHITYVRESSAENIRSKYHSCTGCRKTGKCDYCMKARHTWDDLTPFEKASNIAVADHAPMKCYMLSEAESHGGIDAIKYDLCRVEHERWRRFYFLHNWKYGEIRNYRLKTHPSLLPFENLSKSEQEKDWWSYSCILKEESIKL